MPVKRTPEAATALAAEMDAVLIAFLKNACYEIKLQSSSSYNSKILFNELRD